MQDQLARLPLGLRGEALFSGQNASESQRVLEVRAGARLLQHPVAWCRYGVADVRLHRAAACPHPAQPYATPRA